MIKNTFGILALFCLGLLGCNNKQDVSINSASVSVRYIEQICCGNLMILDQQTIQSSCETYKDSLLRGVNLDEFSIPQNYQFGDMLTIEYEVMPACEAACEITCNRRNGIPVKLLNVE